MTENEIMETPLWFIGGMAALGAFTGVCAALSSSPVVTTALPLIFAIAGGGVGFSVLQLDLREAINRKKIKVLGQSIAALCISSLVFMFGAFAVQPWLVTLVRAETEQVDLSRHVRPVFAVALRAKLAALGASRAEQEKILASTSAENLDNTVLDDTIKLLAAMPRSNQTTADDKLLANSPFGNGGFPSTEIVPAQRPVNTPPVQEQ